MTPRPHILAMTLAGLAATVSVCPGQDAAPVDIRDRIEYRQVAIEALVVEVSDDFSHRLGMRYTYNRDETEHPGNNLEGADFNFPVPFDAVTVPRFNDTNGGFQIPRESRLPGIGATFVGVKVGPGRLSGQIRALMSEGQARVRTRPIVVARHNAEALIHTVEEVPFQDVIFDKTGNPQLSVAFENAGVTLRVKPEIVNIDRQTLDLHILEIMINSVSSFVTIQEVNRPVFALSQAKTKVRMKSGETLIVGGLKTKREVLKTEGIPILSRIPILGLVFKNHRKVLEERDTLFFVTPYILEPDENPILPYDFINTETLIKLDDIGATPSVRR
jgi:type II secretory pathway component GspD/PulD (secretin)